MRTIQFVQTRETITPFLNTDAFQFRKDLKHHWLQKAAIWILKKLRCYYFDYKSEFTTVAVDPDNFMEKLFQQHEALLDLDRRPKTLLIGGEDFRKLMSSPEICRYMSFEGRYKYLRWIETLEVHVIPWMSGMIVMPGKYVVNDRSC